MRNDEIQSPERKCRVPSREVFVFLVAENFRRPDKGVDGSPRSNTTRKALQARCARCYTFSASWCDVQPIIRKIDRSVPTGRSRP